MATNNENEMIVDNETQMTIKETLSDDTSNSPNISNIEVRDDPGHSSFLLNLNLEHSMDISGASHNDHDQSVRSRSEDTNANNKPLNAIANTLEKTFGLLSAHLNSCPFSHCSQCGLNLSNKQEMQRLETENQALTDKCRQLSAKVDELSHELDASDGHNRRETLIQWTHAAIGCIGVAVCLVFLVIQPKKPL